MAELEYACPECGDTFSKPVGLGSHMKKHKPKVTCEHCGQKVSSLDAHKRREHPAEAANSEVERNLRADNQRLRELLGRKEKEITRLKARIAHFARMGIRV